MASTTNVVDVKPIPRSCFHPCKLEAIARWKGADISTRSVTSLKSLNCKEDNFVKAFSIPGIAAKFEPIVYKPCLGNEVTAMRNRYLKDTPVMNLDDAVFNQCLEELMVEMEKTPIRKMTVDEFLTTKKGALGLRYRKAANQLFNEGLDIRKDTKVSPFVKNEKYLVPDKPPRLVYSRDYKFNTMYALYILPIEHALTSLKQVAKGKNFQQRGQAFFEQVFGKWYCENDMSKFEASQRPELFERVQLKMFERWFPGDETILKLFWAKMYKIGHTACGARWRAYGMMASGDMETGCFNTIFNWLACRYFEIKNGYGKGNFIVDGDDSVIQAPRGATPINTFTDFGFDAKLLLKHDYHDVEFCSSKFIQIYPGEFYQVQDLNKLLTSLPYMINKEFNDSLGDYYGSLGYMYRTLYKDIPVYEDLGVFLSTATDRAVSVKILEKASYGAKMAFSLSRPDYRVDPRLAYADISMSFNISMFEMENLIAWFRSHHLNFADTPFKSRDRPNLSYDIPAGHLEAIRVVGRPRPRPHWDYQENGDCWPIFPPG